VKSAKPEKFHKVYAAFMMDSFGAILADKIVKIDIDNEKTNVIELEHKDKSGNGKNNCYITATPNPAAELLELSMELEIQPKNDDDDSLFVAAEGMYVPMKKSFSLDNVKVANLNLMQTECVFYENIE
jgi:hypothetical protein